MRFNIFSVACVLAVTEARVRGGNSDPGNHRKGQFAAWASTFGKNFRSSGDFEKRMETWERSNDLINETNAKADASGKVGALRLKHTFFSDLSSKEREGYLGFKGVNNGLKTSGRENPGASRGAGSSGKHGRGLALSATDVDWAASGHTGPVKNQGGCGSCYTFSSNTCLEARISINDGSEYRRLSEQQIVDCANWDVTSFFYLYACNGGYMNEVWWYQRDNGAMYDEDYEYVSGTTGVAGDCQYDNSKTVSVVQDWYKTPSGDPEALAAELQNGPISIAVAAGNDTWYLYESGVVTSEDAVCNPNSLDHAVVLVGYEGGQEDGDLVVNEKMETECRMQKWKDKFYESGCRYENEQFVDMKYCCWEKLTIEEKQMAANQPYWKIQNSWGANWGDDGFIYFAVEEGLGVCGMNEWGDVPILSSGV